KSGDSLLVVLIAALLRHAIDADPDLFGDFGQLCRGDVEDAVNDYRGLALALDRHRARLDYLLGSLFEADRAAGQSPVGQSPIVDKAAGAHCIERGLASAQRGDYDLAIGEFTKALQADPAAAPAFLHRADAHRLKGDYAQALVDYSAALRINPANSLAL